MKQIISHKTFDDERALYALFDADVSDCAFEGERDGESALKESKSIDVMRCRFSLRYPLWHSHGFSLSDSTMDSGVRAPIWYAKDGKITRCVIDGVKCLRESENIYLYQCNIHSPEFGWRCRGLSISDCEIEAEYFLFESRDIEIDRLKMSGKYSFQYTENMTISDSFLDTKDAFWHCRNTVVKDSTVKSEYLGWYSDGLSLINCHISGTQPFCYCRNLRLVNCTMENADLAFEYSDVQADIKGDIVSVKNPASGRITADGIGEIINEASVMESSCEIIRRQ